VRLSEQQKAGLHNPPNPVLLTKYQLTVI